VSEVRDSSEVGDSSDVVATTLTPAPHGLRAAAWLIDAFVVAVVFALLPQPLPILLLLLLLSGYHTVLLWLTQQTVGKALIGLKVHRIGAKPGFWWALGRSSLGYFAVDLLGAGILVAFLNRQHQTLHDHVFGSLVTVDETGRLTARTLLSRFVAFCQRQSEAVEARKKTIGIVGAFWTFLLGLGQTLEKGVEYLMRLLGARAERPETSSILKAMSAKTATMATAALTAATGAVLAAVPPARAVAEWLLEPRYFVGGPALVTSTFDNDAEEWKISGDAQGQSDDPTYDGGALSARDDQAGGTWYWQAPQSFLGNKLHVYERDLLFRLRVDATTRPFVENDIVLEGGGLTLLYDTPNDPATEWTSYRIRLDESAPWMNRDSNLRATRDEVRQALADVTRLLIRGEFREGPDTGWIDDVSLGAEPRARITRVEAPESIVSGSPRAPVAVTYSGELRFPVQLIYRPRTCPSGYTCVTETADFAQAPPDRRLVGEDFAWCQISASPWAMDWEIVVRDNEHTEIAKPAAVVCRQP
jgi:uncharacterized RDD family membrane protein YckC